MNFAFPDQVTREDFGFAFECIIANDGVLERSLPTLLGQVTHQQGGHEHLRQSSRDDEDFVCAKPAQSERIEWELQRIAAAFGVDEFMECWGEGEFYYQGFSRGVLISWNLDEERGTLCWVAIGEKGNRCVVSRERNLNYGSYAWSDAWEFEAHPPFHGLMARGLYCLDFDQTTLWSQLGHPLSRHQQLECVLQMPREFWPLKWLDFIEGAEPLPVLTVSQLSFQGATI